MSYCMVKGCTSKRKKNVDNSKKKRRLSFFRFPRSPELLKQWVIFCGQTGNFSTKSASICSLHFTIDQYVRDSNAELWNIPSKRKLKADTVPTANGPNSPHINNCGDSEKESSEEEDTETSDDSNDDDRRDSILQMKYKENIKRIIAYKNHNLPQSSKGHLKTVEENPETENLSALNNNDQDPKKNQRISKMGKESISGVRGRQLLESMDVIILAKSARIDKYTAKTKNMHTPLRNLKVHNKRLIDRFDSLVVKIKSLKEKQITLEGKLFTLAFVNDIKK